MNTPHPPTYVIRNGNTANEYRNASLAWDVYNSLKNGNQLVQLLADGVVIASNDKEAK